MSKIQSYLLMTFIMCIWGFNVTAIKVLVDYFPPLTITSIRLFTAGAAVFLMLGLMKKIRRPATNEWKFIIGGSLLNVLFHHYFLSLGLTNTTATNGGLILGSGPLLTAVLSAILLKRTPTIIQQIGFLIGGIGVLFIVLSGEKGLSSLSIGDLNIFFAILVQAFSFILISKATRTMDPRLLTGYMLTMGSISLFFVSLFMEPGAVKDIFHAPLSIWIVFFLSALLATAFGNMIYNISIGKIGPAESSIFLNMNTFFSLVGASVFLGEVITGNHLIGFIFIIIGVLFGSGILEEIRKKRKLTMMKDKRFKSKGT